MLVRDGVPVEVGLGARKWTLRQQDLPKLTRRIAIQLKPDTNREGSSKDTPVMSYLCQQPTL
jgi:hypothetical protein